MSPCTTSPRDEPGIAEQLVRLLDAAGGERLANDARGDAPALDLDRRHHIDGEVPQRPAAASRSGVPARLRPKRKSNPTAAPEMPSRRTRMSLTKLSGAGSASSASNRSTMAPESPVAANRRSLAVSSVSRNSGSCGRKKLRGWGSKVRAAAGPPERPGAAARRRDHGAVAAMHAVEIADGDDGARQRRGSGSSP